MFLGIAGSGFYLFSGVFFQRSAMGFWRRRRFRVENRFSAYFYGSHSPSNYKPSPAIFALQTSEL